MTEIERRIDTLEKLIPEIEGGINLYAYERAALQAALQALREKAENDRLREDGRLVVLPEARLPLIWGDDDQDTVLCPCCERDLMGGYSDNCKGEEYIMCQCPHCGQPIDDTEAVTREEAEKALEELL